MKLRKMRALASTHAGHGPILVIDDDADVREAVAELLRHHGREVIVAHNGRDALLTLAKATAPCLILLDLMMPVMDGFQFLDQLASMASEIPVLVLSAHDSVHPGEGYPHVLGTLRKPFDGPQLLSALDEHC